MEVDGCCEEVVVLKRLLDLNELYIQVRRAGIAVHSQSRLLGTQHQVHVPGPMLLLYKRAPAQFGLILHKSMRGFTWNRQLRRLVNMDQIQTSLHCSSKLIWRHSLIFSECPGPVQTEQALFGQESSILSQILHTGYTIPDYKHTVRLASQRPMRTRDE